jgi:hypothetical protein
MAFSNWDTYRQLLEKLTERRADWSKSKTYADFDEAIRARCSEIAALTNADGVLEYDSLLGELTKEFVDDKDLVYEQLKLVALAIPAEDRGLGPEWHGYFVSERANGEEVYATDRFAIPSSWEKVEVSIAALALTYDEDTGLMYLGDDWFLKDGVTQVWEDPEVPGEFYDREENRYIHGVLQADTVQDLRQSHFDEETNRWRRWVDLDGEFEYYHQEDGVWERLHNGAWERLHDVAGTALWHRYHSDQFGWVPYDTDSTSWLDPVTQYTVWRGYTEVGTPLPQPLAAEPVVVEPAVVEPAVAEPAPPAAPEQATRQLVEQIAVSRADVLARILEKADERGYGSQISEAQIAAALDSLVLAAVASGQPPQQ